MALVEVWQSDCDLETQDETFHRMFGNRETVQSLLSRGTYRKVATISTPAGLHDDQALEDAWVRSQNGVHVQNWLRESTEEVFVKSSGAPSTSVGDIFVIKGVRFVVAKFGFEPLEN
jgi:hypothetical protein